MIDHETLLGGLKELMKKKDEQIATLQKQNDELRVQLDQLKSKKHRVKKMMDWGNQPVGYCTLCQVFYHGKRLIKDDEF